MKNQVLSIEQMQTLKDKGFDISIGSMMWVCHYDTLTLKDHAELMLRDEIIEQCKECMPTMTLQDILGFMPNMIEALEYIVEEQFETRNTYNLCLEKCNKKWNVGYFSYDSMLYACENDNILQCYYQTLLWCIDNGHIEIKPQ